MDLLDKPYKLWHPRNHIADPGYDSDPDEYDRCTDMTHSLSEWHNHSPEWRAALTSRPLANDQALTRTKHSFKPGEELCHFGFAVKGADVIISLSDSEKDSLMVPSESLKKMSPWFAASLKEEWQHNKVSEEPADGSSTVLKRYELEYDNAGNAMLVGKTKATSPVERATRTREMLSNIENVWNNDLEEPELRHAFDNSFMNIWRRGKPSQSDGDPIWRGEIAHFEEPATIMAYKLGFSILCGFPLRLNRSFWLSRFSGFFALVIFRLLRWTDRYLSGSESLIRSTYSRIADFIMDEVLIKRETLYDLGIGPWTGMRIACLLRSERVFLHFLGVLKDRRSFDHHWATPDTTMDLTLCNWVEKYESWLDDEEVSVYQTLFLIRMPENSIAWINSNNIWSCWLDSQVGSRDILRRAAQNWHGIESPTTSNTALSNQGMLSRKNLRFTDRTLNVFRKAAVEIVRRKIVQNIASHIIQDYYGASTDFDDAVFIRDLQNGFPWEMCDSHIKDSGNADEVQMEQSLV